MKQINIFETKIMCIKRILLIDVINVILSSLPSEIHFYLKKNILIRDLAISFPLIATLQKEVFFVPPKNVVVNKNRMRHIF